MPVSYLSLIWVRGGERRFPENFVFNCAEGAPPPLLSVNKSVSIHLFIKNLSNDFISC
jgi:hypothetical protein